MLLSMSMTLPLPWKDPEAFVKTLTDTYKFKLKGTGPISYHLGADFVREEDGTLSMMPRKYIEKVCDGYERMFGEKPHTRYHSPLEGGDHPELDQSEFLDPHGIQQYQSTRYPAISIPDWLAPRGCILGSL